MNILGWERDMKLIVARGSGFLWLACRNLISSVERSMVYAQASRAIRVDNDTTWTILDKMRAGSGQRPVNHLLRAA